ncbi:MAG: hypothetical protein M1832_003434 [Thelocarpon impressellum]|nr:MAG: hypothetical protein M1832_003434 [Thelocarpon impressellum]
MPSSSGRHVEIPVVDISTSSQEVGGALVDAVARSGFVFIKDQHNRLTPQVVDRAFELIGDYKEAFNMGEFTVDGRALQILPKCLASHEDELGRFSGLCSELCNQILRLFAVGLKYPSLAASGECDPEVDVRAGAHSDYGSITLLFQRPSQPGLEVRSPAATWVPVPVHPPGTEDDAMPPILVNVGDLLEHWTNGLLRSTVHRVIFPADPDGQAKDRYSIAYFCHPVHDTKLELVPSAMVQARATPTGTASDVGVLTASQHLQSRLHATYGFSKADNDLGAKAM